MEISRDSKKILEGASGYVLLTDKGINANMQTTTILSCVTALLYTMKKEGAIDNDDIDKVSELAKVDSGLAGTRQLLDKLKDLLEELDK